MGSLTEFPATLRRLGWILATLSALLWAPGPALARDRPGTPTDEKAWECWDIAGVASTHWDGPPIVCVMFRNTATERVRFDTEWTIDRVKGTQQELRAHVACALLGSNYPGGTECVAGMNLLGYGASTELGSHVDWTSVADQVVGAPQVRHEEPSRPGQSFIVRNLEFDTEYCFRFKARNVSNDVVSAEWSNWACARTAPRPPKPPRPANVSVKFFPAQWNGSSKTTPIPNHLEVSWTVDNRYVAYVEVHEARTDAQDDVTRFRSNPGGSLNIEVPPDRLTNVTFRRFYVCAHNLSGDSCSARVTAGLDRGIVPKPSYDATAMAHPGRDASDTRPSGFDAVLPRNDGRAVQRPSGDFTAMAAPPALRPAACRSGYVWRIARADDGVCVTPAARARVAQENADAASRVDPGGAYGPNTCVSGYVWRNAFPGDLVCVTPAARTLALQENADGASHRVDSALEFRAPR